MKQNEEIVACWPMLQGDRNICRCKGDIYCRLRHNGINSDPIFPDKVVHFEGAKSYHWSGLNMRHLEFE